MQINPFIKTFPSLRWKMKIYAARHDQDELPWIIRFSGDFRFQHSNWMWVYLASTNSLLSRFPLCLRIRISRFKFLMFFSHWRNKILFRLIYRWRFKGEDEMNERIFSSFCSSPEVCLFVFYVWGEQQEQENFKESFHRNGNFNQF